MTEICKNRNDLIQRMTEAMSEAADRDNAPEAIPKPQEPTLLPPPPVACELSPQMLGVKKLLSHLGAENIIFAVCFFWRWSGQIWRKVEDVELKKIIQAQQSNNPKLSGAFINGALDLLKNETYLAGIEFNANTSGISVANGELYLINGKWELHPHCREHFRTVALPVTFDPTAKAPRFEEFLNEVFRDDADGGEKGQLLCEALGYALLTTSRFEKFFLLVGAGANGKSVFLEVVTEFLGPENVAAVQPSQFENRFQRAHLHGKLANIVTELAEGAAISDAELKAIVSGELLTAEHKLKPPFNFRPYATCFFATNHLPHTRDFSKALFRRAIIISFNRVFAEAEQDRSLASKLKEELPGILNLALEAISGVLQRGHFTETASCLAEKEAWRLEADQVAAFANECCVLDSTNESFTSIASLYDAYKTWCDENGIKKCLTKIRFGKRIILLGARQDKGTGGQRVFKGILLNQA